MKTQLSHHDLEALSAYLDGTLSTQEKSRLEYRLYKEADLRDVFEGLRHTRILLRNSPKIRAPHNFTLTLQMVGLKEKQKSGFVYPFLKFSTVLASILFVFALLGDFFIGKPMPMTNQIAKEMAPAAAPAEPMEEFGAQTEMEMMAPTSTIISAIPLPTETAKEMTSEFSNAPMEPLPSTEPATMKVEPTSEMQEAPLLAAEPDESAMQSREVVTGSESAEEMEAVAGVAFTDTEMMADQAIQTEEQFVEPPTEIAIVGETEDNLAELSESPKNLWRILEIIFGSLIILFGMAFLLYRSLKKI